jgi:hypothetical protein
MVLELEEILTILGDDFLNDKEVEDLVKKLEVIASHVIDKTMNEGISNEQ